MKSLAVLLGWGNMRGPSHSGFLLELAGHPLRGGDVDEMVAAGAFDLPTGKLDLAHHVLLAVGTLKFEFAHRLSLGL